MKQEIKKYLKCCGMYYVKTTKNVCVSCQKNTANKNYSVRSKID